MQHCVTHPQHWKLCWEARQTIGRSRTTWATWTSCRCRLVLPVMTAQNLRKISQELIRRAPWCVGTTCKTISLLGHYNSHLIEHVWVKRLQRPGCHFLSFPPVRSPLSCAIKAKNDKNTPFLWMSCFLSSAPVFTLICTKADAMHNESQ